MFYLVDVFANHPFSGNQLAVVRNGRRFSADEMQAIAREFNFSETTFIMADEERDGGYDVRIFTPRAEIPFAGHPTLGTAWVIQNHIIGRPVARVALNLGVGQIPVDITYENGVAGELIMRQKEPKFGKPVDSARVAPLLGLKTADIDSHYPVREVSTGIPFLIVPLTGLAAQRRIAVDSAACGEFIATRDAKAILTFCQETVDKNHALNVRMFAEYFGVAEDPATGSANGCLAGYLVEHSYLGDGALDILVEQGLEIGRPSVLHLMASCGETGISVRVGGRVIPIATGELL